MTAIRRLPVAPEAERALVAAVLFGHLAQIVSAGITPDDFHTPAHREVYEAALKLDAAEMPIDSVSVTENLRQRERLNRVEGGEVAIAGLADHLPTSAHIDHYAATVLRRARVRRYITDTTRLLAEAYTLEDDSIDDFVERAETSLLSSLRSGAKGEYEPLAAEQVAAMKALLARSRNPEPVGVLTGFKGLDDITKGWRPGTLTVIGGRPHVSKTALLLQLLGYGSDSGTPGLIFSLEQTKREMAERRNAADGKIDLDLLMGDGTGLSAETYKSILRVVEKRTDDRMLWIDATPALSIVEIRARARRFAADRKIPRNRSAFKGIIGLDFIQIIKGVPGKKYGNREVEVADVAVGLKNLALELAMPVVALSQLNRDVERRQKDQRRPIMTDLRESGAIEAAADFVGVLWRPEDDESDGDITHGRVEMANLKNRSGRSGEKYDVAMHFEGRHMTFTQVSNREPPAQRHSRGGSPAAHRQPGGGYRDGY